MLLQQKFAFRRKAKGVRGKAGVLCQRDYVQSKYLVRLSSNKLGFQLRTSKSYSLQQHGKGTNGEQISFTHLKGPSGMKPKDNNMQIHVTKTLFLDYSTLSNERILRYPVSVMGQIIIGSSDRSKSIYGVLKIRSRMLFVCFSTFS